MSSIAGIAEISRHHEDDDDVLALTIYTDVTKDDDLERHINKLQIFNPDLLGDLDVKEGDVLVLTLSTASGMVRDVVIDDQKLLREECKRKLDENPPK